MLATIPILLLVIVSAIMIGSHLFQSLNLTRSIHQSRISRFSRISSIIKHSFRYYWLMAAATAFLTWFMVLLARINLPEEIALVNWEPEILFSISPTLLLDDVSWPFAMALVTLLLAMILTDVLRQEQPEDAIPGWATWASGMLIAALGLVSVLAGNILTLLLAWAALDMAEGVIWLSKARDKSENERIVVLLSTRLGGIVALIAAGLIAYQSGSPLVFTTTNPQISIYLVIAAGLRLGVLPPNAPLDYHLPQYGTLNTLLRLIPAGANLTLLTRAAEAGVSTNGATTMLILAGIAALYGSLAWINLLNERDGGSFWVLGTAALALASAVRAQPQATLVWGIALLLSGGSLLFSTAKLRWLVVLPLLGALNFSTLPFTPTWQGLLLFISPFTPINIFYLLAHSVFLAGYLYYYLRRPRPMIGIDRWVWVIYPLGLVLLPMTHILIIWWPQIGQMNTPTLFESWPGLVSVGVAITSLFLFRDTHQRQIRLAEYARTTLSMNWLYRFFWSVYHGLGHIFSLVSRVLEGPGGLLWALLLLTLLISLIAQTAWGG